MTFMARWTSKKIVIVSTFFNEAILRLKTQNKGYTADSVRKSYIKVSVLVFTSMQHDKCIVYYRMKLAALVNSWCQ